MEGDGACCRDVCQWPLAAVQCCCLCCCLRIHEFGSVYAPRIVVHFLADWESMAVPRLSRGLHERLVPVASDLSRRLADVRPG